MDIIMNSEEYKKQLVNAFFGEHLDIDIDKYAKPIKEKWENYFKNK